MAELTLSQYRLWRSRLRGIAFRSVAHLAWHQDREALIDDLEMVGWVTLLERGLDSPFLYFRLVSAMRDEISRWLYGVTDGKAPRYLKTAVDIADVEIESPDLSLEEQMMLRETVRLIEARLPRKRTFGGGRPSKTMQVWRAMVLSWHPRRDTCGVNIAPEIARQCGVGNRAIYNGRKILARLAQEIIPQAAPISR